MTETASLVIKVDSRGAKSASADLDKLTESAGRTERGTKKASDEFTNLAAKIFPASKRAAELSRLQELVNEKFKAGKINADQYQAALRRISLQQEKNNKALAEYDGVVEDATSKTSALTVVKRAFVAALSGAAIAKTVSAFIQMADASANMSARLRLATKSQEEFNKAHKETFAIAQRTSSDLGSVVDLYAKLSQSTGELGLTQSQVLRMTETITQAFQVSGATAQEAAGGLRQLGQAMAGGTLRAEEFNSIIESSPRIVQALADHFGVSFGKVRQLVNDGAISSEEFAKAMLNASQKIQAEFDQMPLTVGRATQQVRNAMLGMVGGADEASGATSGLAEAIQDLARALEDPGFKALFNELVTGAVSAAGAFVTLATEVRSAMSAMQDWLTLQLGGNRSMGGENLAEQRRELAKIEEELQRRATSSMTGFSALGLQSVEGLERRKAILEETIRLNEALFGDPDRPENRVRWIDPSVGGTMGEDRHLSQGGEGGAAAKLRDRTKARKELTEAEKAWREFEKDMVALEGVWEDTRREYANAALDRMNEAEDAKERQRQATDALIEEMEFELSLIGKTREEQEALIAVRLAGAGATDEQVEAIKRLMKQTREGREAQRDIEDMRDSARDLFATIVTDSDRASSALDRFFDNLKRRAAEKLFDALLGGMQGSTNGGGWAGFVQGFMGALGGGRAAGGPVQGGQAYIVGEQGPELFSPGQSGRVHPIGAAAVGAQKPPVLNITINKGADEDRVSDPRPNSRGGYDIEVMVKGIVQRGFGDGSFDGAMSMFGARRQGHR